MFNNSSTIFRGPDRQSFGARLARIRKRRRMGQEELARKVGVVRAGASITPWSTIELELRFRPSSTMHLEQELLQRIRASVAK